MQEAEGRTPVINSRNQRYMAHPSITAATERFSRFCYILLQRYAVNPSITTPLWCSARNVFVIATDCMHTPYWWLVEN